MLEAAPQFPNPLTPWGVEDKERRLQNCEKLVQWELET
jgi:hypothetical protein